MKIGDFNLDNEEKLQRAIHGTMGRGGKLVGGVGEDAEEGDILAEYDRLGGLVTKDGGKVKTGSFYDFEKRSPRKKPNVVLLYRVNGKEVEVADGESLPLEVRAQQVAEAGEEAAEAPKAKKASAKKGGKKASKKDKEDNEEEMGE